MRATRWPVECRSPHTPPAFVRIFLRGLRPSRNRPWRSGEADGHPPSPVPRPWPQHSYLSREGWLWPRATKPCPWLGLLRMPALARAGNAYDEFGAVRRGRETVGAATHPRNPLDGGSRDPPPT
jgi:hypothetical protein